MKTVGASRACEAVEMHLHSSKMWTVTEACLTSVTKNVDTEVACMSTRVVDGPLRLHSNVQGPFLEVFLEFS